MASYLLIESRDPYEYNDPHYFYSLANELADRGNEVVFFLVQNGVLATRKGAAGDLVQELRQRGKVRVLADAFSLRERGIRQERIVDGIQLSDVDELVDLLLVDGRKAIWH